jgi:uncharacterized protein (DUF1697 family)
MPVFVSMLRGINNMGARRVKMDDLRALYESLGLRQAQTCVQSGNVIFKSRHKNTVKLAALIEGGIAQRFGFKSSVVLRTTDELRAVVAANPFSARKDLNGSKLLIWFLPGAPGAAARKAVLSINTEPEELWVRMREVFIYFPNGIAERKLQWTAVERALQMPGTGRNWNSVNKLLEMARAMEAGG